MKQPILLALLLFLNLTFISAQEQKFMIGGNLGLQYSSTSYMSGLSSSLGVSNLGASFSPIFGYHLTPKKVIGAELGLHWTRYVYGGSALNINPSNYSTSRSVSVAPFFRNYFDNSFFIHGEFIVGRNVIESVQPDQSFTDDYKQIYSSFGLGVGLGYSFSLCEKVKFEPMVKYKLIRNNEKTNLSTDYLNSDFTFQVGFTYRF